MALFSSRGPALAAVETLKSQGLTTVEAIDRLAGEASIGIPSGTQRGDDAGEGVGFGRETSRADDAASIEPGIQPDMHAGGQG